MNVMAIDTSSDLLHIALESGSEYESHTHRIARRFSEELVLRMKKMAQRASLTLKELDLIVCSQGPGSFTGLRIGMAAAKGVSLGASIPLVSCPTLQIYAYPFSALERVVLPLLDAKKGRYYTALFQKGRRLSNDADISLEEVATLIAPYDEIFLTGYDAHTAFDQLCDIVTKKGIKTKLSLDSLKYRDYGESMIRLGTLLLSERGADPPNSGPTYIRKSDAEVSLEMQQQEVRLRDETR